MLEIKEKSKCSGCHACMAACPKNCISMKPDDEGFLYPVIDAEKCVGCGACEKVCPIIEKCRPALETRAYAAFNKDNDIRLESSSGGLFTLVAKEVISSGGVVFGASFDKNFNVCHICVDNVDELSRLRGSKYLQSVIGDTYKKAKNALDNGKRVYFTGTPCQIEGLLKYLGKDYDNLITSDIICHGVPSAMVWQTYLKSLDSAPVKNATFRDKSLGWQGYSVKIEFENGHVHKEMARDNVYIKAFLSDICLRPSCYNCSFKSIKRASDLTLADFWGINNVFPKMNDNKGISLIFVHTAKGAAMLESIKEQMAIIALALESNPSATKSVIKPKKRDKFMKKVNSENFEMLVRKYTKRTLIQKVKSKVKGFVKKILK